MIRQRHPDTAVQILQHLSNTTDATPQIFQDLNAAREVLVQEGFRAPTWEEAAAGIRAPAPTGSDAEASHAGQFEPGEWQHGWQYRAATSREHHYRDASLMPRMSRAGRALLRSQSGPAAGTAFMAIPTSSLSSFTPQCFRVLLLRRLRLPLPADGHTCRCGRNLDTLGDHRAACPRAGILAGRGYALEAAAARICREAGARVVTNCFVRDLNLTAPPDDGRRLEVVANNLPLWNGAQLAIDTTLVSALRANGESIPNAHAFNGRALRNARRRKERTYPELAQYNGRVRLVVLALETGGRWSNEAIDFIKQLARAKARATPAALRAGTELAWYRRWINMLGCAAQRAFALSLLSLPAGQGHNLDGHVPFLGDVLVESRWASAPTFSRLQ